MKDAFLDNDKVKGVNEALFKKKGHISTRSCQSPRYIIPRELETGVMPHLDDVPLTLVAKANRTRSRSSSQWSLSTTSHLILIEEAETTYRSRPQRPHGHIAERRGMRQLVITTHSSFVLNKLGVESDPVPSRFGDYAQSTDEQGRQDYFMRLPGHDTLRFNPGQARDSRGRSIGRIDRSRPPTKSDGKMPLEAGVDVIR